MGVRGGGDVWIRCVQQQGHGGGGWGEVMDSVCVYGGGVCNRKDMVGCVYGGSVCMEAVCV